MTPATSRGSPHVGGAGASPAGAKASPRTRTSSAHRAGSRSVVGRRHLPRLHRGGMAYLATILDCCSRSVVGWSIADHLRSELVVDALEWRRRAAGQAPDSSITPTRARSTSRSPCPGGSPKPRSVGRWAGWERRTTTPPAEGLFATIKRELVHRHRFPTRAAARSAVLSSSKCSTTAGGCTQASRT
jgi:transposase InsO family protein